MESRDLPGCKRASESMHVCVQLQRLRKETFLLQSKCESLSRRLMKATGFQWRMGVVATAFRIWKDYVRYSEFYNEMEEHPETDDRAKIESLKREIELLRRELQEAQQSPSSGLGDVMAPTPRGSQSCPTSRKRLSRMSSIQEVSATPRAAAVETSELDALRASHARKEEELDQAKKALDAAQPHSEQLRAAHAAKERELDAARQAYLNQLFVQSKLVSQVVTTAITKALGHVSSR
jgi:hypothetical protein